ncbi:phosphatase PAP2 family protein [Dethiothermospora halolimnae]|uniref:phosphatase PAP2 family protein n=1 Tax=Dethiothermospora halolimnae TaxID=3114390 RepID=UPI003CCC3B0A
MKKIFYKYNYFLLFLLLVIPNYLYSWTNDLNMQVHNVSTFIDEYIPFISWMIIPYDLWYIYIWGGLVLLAFMDKKLFLTHGKTVLATKLTCMLIFLIYPSYMVRPEITGDDIFSKLVLLTYENDNPVNLFPSIHVLQAILTHVAIINLDKTKMWMKITSLVYMILVVFSTVFVKQHYFVDIIGGSVLAIIAIKYYYGKSYSTYRLSVIKELLEKKRYKRKKAKILRG